MSDWLPTVLSATDLIFKAALVFWMFQLNKCNQFLFTQLAQLQEHQYKLGELVVCMSQKVREMSNRGKEV